MFSHLQDRATAFKLGGVTVAPVAIAASIGIFVIGLVLTRMFRRWLETQYLPRTRLDVGLSATFATGVSYIGGVVALIVASAYLGLHLTQVTLIASALTVGIGFGLQSVIQNFVAGLILLAGRPIRVGDWIAVGGQEGDVQRINVRATEIKLFDGSMLILPNSELVAKPVRNVTWGAPLGQVQISFTVGYDADLDMVAATLMDVFKQTRGVLKDPAPYVVLTEFKDTGAAFTGYAYVATPRAVTRTKSDILLELGRRLREAGIRPGAVVQQAVSPRRSRGAADDADRRAARKYIRKPPRTGNRCGRDAGGRAGFLRLDHFRVAEAQPCEDVAGVDDQAGVGGDGGPVDRVVVGGDQDGVVGGQPLPDRPAAERRPASPGCSRVGGMTAMCGSWKSQAAPRASISSISTSEGLSRGSSTFFL